MKLTEAFYARDVLDVAPDLIGKLVVRQMPDGQCLRCRITEAEAYRGEEDGACHARRGKTPRTEMMYRPGGYAYVYLVYGLHSLMNVVTGPEGMPQAALVRALEKPLDGPAKWTKALQVTREQNGLWLPDSEQMWLEDDGAHPMILTAPRVGVDYAPEKWRDMPWRFIAG